MIVLYFAQHLGYTVFSWTSTLPIYMETSKKPCPWSNQRVFVMDQAECVYFKGTYMASNRREENGTFDSQISWNPLDSKSVQKNHVSWLKMKFYFSSMLTTSWLCQDKAGLWKSLKSVENWMQDQIARKAQTHTGCPCGVCEEWDFTPSTPAYWGKCTNFLFSQRKQGQTRMEPHWLQESVWNLKMTHSILTCTAAYWKFGASRYLDKTRYFIPRVHSFQIQLEDTRHWLEE